MPLALHASVTGDPASQDVLVLHGLFGSSGNWRSITAKLSASYCVHSLDLRNHGQSPWAETMSYIDMASDIVKYISDHQLQRPNLIGHSMGGKTVMAMLQNFSMPIAQAIILDIAPVGYQHDHDQLLDAMHTLDLKSLESRSQADLLLSEQISEAGIRQFLLQNLAREGSGFRWRINLAAISANRSLIFSYPGGEIVTEKVIFIAGEQSDYIQPAHYPALKSHFPNAEIAHIAGAGHWLHAEQPAALLKLLFRYLDPK